MTVYWMMFALPALMVLMPWKATSALIKLAWVGMACLFVLLVGLRYQVGGDWVPYLLYFKQAYGARFGDAVQINHDPGYYFFNWLFSNQGLDVWSINLLCAVLSVSGVFAVARRQPQPWLALAVAAPYILIVVCMGYLRQSAAFGLVCWALLAVEDKRPWRFLVLVVIAATFHKSAVVAMPLYLFTQPRLRFYHWALLGMMLAAIVAVLVLETLEAQWHSYVEQKMESEGAVIRALMNLPPALLLLMFGKKLGLHNPASRHWYWVAWVSLASLAIVKLASTAVDRLALYLLPLQMVVYAHAYRMFRDRIFRSLVPIGVLLLYAAVLFVWLNFGKHADDWLPYQFYPLVGMF